MRVIQLELTAELKAILTQFLGNLGYEVVESGGDVTVVADYQGYGKVGGPFLSADKAFIIEFSASIPIQ